MAIARLAGTASNAAPHSGSRLQDAWRRFRIPTLALLAMAFSGTAWADSLALVSGAGQSGLAGTTGALPIKVQVRNVDGVVVAGRTINWTTSNGFGLGAASSITDANGVASVTFTYGNSGSTPIIATDATAALSAQAIETSIGGDTLTLVSGGGQAGLVGTVSAQPIVVQLRNASGTPIAGRTIGWSDLTTYSQVSAASSVTNASGQASVNFTYLEGPQAINGNVATIRATDSTSGQFANATETSLGAAHLESVSPDALSGVVGSTSPPIVVRAVKADGSPLAGATVNWADRFATGNVTVSSPSTVTDANGLTSITIFYVGGFLPTDGDIEASYGFSQVDVPYTYVNAGSLTLMSPMGLSGAPSSVSGQPIVVEARKGDGTPAAGVTVNWTTPLGDAVPAAASSVTDGAGRASVGFTFGTVVSNIRATDTSTGRTVIARLEVTPSDSIRIVSGEGQNGTAGGPGAQPIVVEVLDSAGSPIVGRTINWISTPIDSNGVTLAAPTSITNASGQASMTFSYLLAGRTSIDVQDPISFRQVSIRVAAVGMNTFTVISGDNQSGLAGTHSAQPLVAELRDAFGTPIVGATVNWSYNCGTGPCNAVLDTTSTVTDNAGRVSVGYTHGPIAGYSGFEADDPVSRSRAEFNTITIGADSLSLISGDGQTGQPNAAGAQPMVVQVNDASGTPVAGRTIFWSVSVPPGAAIANAASSITDAAGRASMGFTYGSSSTPSTLVGNDAVTGLQIQFHMTAVDVLNTATIISGNGQAGLPGTAAPQPIIVEIRDAGNLPVPGQSVAWSIVSGPATLGSTTTVTDASGRVSANFNFGPTAGTSIIQAKDPSNPNGQLVQASVTALGSNQTVAEVSGNSQILALNTPSAPMVVELRNFANLPVVGATIDWTTSSGTLASASTVTDANGQSSNTVTVTTGGTVTVQASSVLASAPFVFTLNSSVVATLPNLTPTQQSVAVAIDNSCVALTNKPTLTPEEADLLARCQDITTAAGLDPNATAAALDELITDTAQAQSSAAVVAAGAQFQNIKLRQMALRSGSKTSSLSNLTFTGPGGVISLESLMNALAADDVTPPAPTSFSRWGFFAAGNVGRGEADAGRSTPAYDYDIDGLTAGIDYRLSDDFIFGGALGYTRQDTNLADSQGTVKLSGTSLSAYGTWSIKDVWYVDGVITYGWNQFKMTRRINYTLPTAGGGTTSIDQLATGDPNGDLLSGGLTFGGDFHKDAFSISPYGQLLYTRVGFDSYEESLHSGAGSGLGLAVDARTVTALTGILGSRFSYTHSTDWGVVVPTASLEWNHEFKDDQQAISAHLIHDPTQTTINVAGDPMDTQYMRVGLGLSMILAHGRSGFFLYEYMLGRDGQSQENFALGIRLEF